MTTAYRWVYCIHMIEKGCFFAERYELTKQLGRGGFSEVWLAKDKLTDVQVAIKIYAPGVGIDDDGISSFTKEFALVFEMNHSNILHPTHYDCYQRMPYLILPYCKNGSAFKFVTSNTRLPEDECWKLIRDVAEGLAYLHEKTPPIIHQDIKPDNILISDENRYMITDFGISTRIRSTINRNKKNKEDEDAGTLAYMGPERFSSNPAPIMASDIWSLGATLYEILTGDVPFGNSGGLVQKNGAEIPIITQNYSEDLKNTIYTCISLDTWNRPTSRQLADFASSHIISNSAPINLSNSLNNSLGSSKAGGTGKGNNNDGNEHNTNRKFSKKTKIGIVIAALLALIIAPIFLHERTHDIKTKTTQPVTTSFEEMAMIYYNKGAEQEAIGDQLKLSAISGAEIDSLLDISYLNAFDYYNRALKYKDSIKDPSIVNMINSGIDSINTDLTETYHILIKKASDIKKFLLPGMRDSTVVKIIENLEEKAENIKNTTNIDINK